MNEELRNEIIRRRQGRASLRQIARDLGVARDTVQSVVRQWEAERRGSAAANAAPVPARRPSLVDPYAGTIQQLLQRYPDITIQRVFEELRGQGYRGGLTIVRERVLELRPQPVREPVVRFETAPGAQAQMDYSSYDIDFTAEGRRRVHLFSYLLSYSRRQYLRFVETQDLPTTLREHIRAFAYLGGVAATCLYDNMKVVVLRHGDEGPLYNPKFLAFATHYGFTPWACRVRRSQTKGKVERPFHYVETNLLNGRTFATLAHLNEVTAGWLGQVADVRVHRETKQRPIDRHAEERPYLIALPTAAYEIAEVVYRVVNVEGYVAYQQNFYAVPCRYIGQVVPVRATETELIVYGPDIDEVARHPRFARHTQGQRTAANHPPGSAARPPETLLRERFTELGPQALRFLDGLLAGQRYGKQQACKVLALQSTYARADVLAALARAVRFGAYTLAAVERILATQAQPKPVLDTLADALRRQLPARLGDNPVSPRPLADYQNLIEDSTAHGPPPSSTDRHADADTADHADDTADGAARGPA
jgi:transposase